VREADWREIMSKWRSAEAGRANAIVEDGSGCAVPGLDRDWCENRDSFAAIEQHPVGKRWRCGEPEGSGPLEQTLDLRRVRLRP
jgi:hypothetical protein